jgi:hypothetical protein
VVVPVIIPETIPEAAPIVATAGLLLLHVPGAVASVRVIVVPGHNAVGPIIGAGSGLTVIVALPVIVAVQPVVVLVAVTV